MGETPADFLEFAHARSDHLFRTACLLTGDRHPAEDLVQETLAQDVPVLGRIDRTRAPVAYARTVLVRAFVDGRVTGQSGDPASGSVLRAPCSVLYDDGTGPAVVSVSVLDAVLGFVDCGRETAPICQVLPDGTAVRTEKLSPANGQLLWVVSATRPDGRRVGVSAINSEQPITDSGHPARAEPPLTADRLQAVALSPHWARPGP